MKILCLVFCIGGVAGLFAVTAFCPSVKIKGKSFALFWTPPLLAAVLLLACGVVDAGEVWSGLTAATPVNPFKILTLFLSVTALSVFLDEAGFFELLAYKTLGRVKNNQRKLFWVLFLTVSILTVFTSNDVVVLTFTPFICFFCKRAKINPLPYLIAEFVAANTLSMLLVIGNPTNIYLASAFNISFGDYFLTMAAPAILGALAVFVVLRLIFNKSLKAPLNSDDLLPPLPKNKFLIGLGLTHLILCTVALAISGYVGIEMWYVSLIFALSLYLFAGIYLATKKISFLPLKNTLKRIPWQLVPFVLSMFVLVLSLSGNGYTQKIANLLNTNNKFNIFSYGIASYLSANALNNIPMSVLFSCVCQNLASPLPAVYACIVGSNLGALLTPVGALAGLMWTDLLKAYGQKISWTKFALYCGTASFCALFVTLFVLWLLPI